jgi:hypothetical protein
MEEDGGRLMAGCGCRDSCQCIIRSGTATLRLNVVSSGTSGSISHLQNFVLPADSVWRRYRIFPQVLRTAFSGNYDVGRVAGAGTLEMRDVRLEAV